MFRTKRQSIFKIYNSFRTCPEKEGIPLSQKPNDMTRIINIKRHLHFAFAFVKHAYLLISVCKMNYHTDIVNF